MRHQALQGQGVPLDHQEKLAQWVHLESRVFQRRANLPRRERWASLEMQDLKVHPDHQALLASTAHLDLRARKEKPVLTAKTAPMDNPVQ